MELRWNNLILDNIHGRTSVTSVQERCGFCSNSYLLSSNKLFCRSSRCQNVYHHRKHYLYVQIIEIMFYCANHIIIISCYSLHRLNRSRSFNFKQRKKIDVLFFQLADMSFCFLEVWGFKNKLQNMFAARGRETNFPEKYC